MKKYAWFLMVFVAASPGFAGSVPNQITYQGTLKESGSPVTGTRPMQFSLTNVDGTIVYWSGATTSVTVTNGLFSTILSPTGVDWQNATPYIQVSVNGQLLLPREPVTSTAYALECGSIADGSTLSGMIAMFAGNCPTGWTRFTALDGLFPMGSASYGATGGAATHSHTLLTSGTVSSNGSSTVGVGHGGHILAAWSGGSTYAVDVKEDLTDSQSNIPPYLTVVFCQKT